MERISAANIHAVLEALAQQSASIASAKPADVAKIFDCEVEDLEGREVGGELVYTPASERPVGGETIKFPARLSLNGKGPKGSFRIPVRLDGAIPSEKDGVKTLSSKTKGVLRVLSFSPKGESDPTVYLRVDLL